MKWQINFGVTHELEYKEIIEFFNKVPSKQKGAIGRKIMLEGLKSLKEKGDPIILEVLNWPEKERTDPPSQHRKLITQTTEDDQKKKKINNKLIGLLET
ncbi:hypothetical protein [Desulfofalx alkaliphila]|uniref:hypothetical protein n=1 Tax=Desulfofalx alkaliphila TaxID=105483 RepID=UPI0004E1B244|nr:hypothetical protein [Desulfofalx alkaliphila]